MPLEVKQYSSRSRRRVLFLYGSQTGNAEEISRHLREEARTQHDLDATLLCMSRHKKVDLAGEELVVFVVSTTGNGDFPDTVSGFWRQHWKMRAQKAHLARLRFAVLGLGDSSCVFQPFLAADSTDTSVRFLIWLCVFRPHRVRKSVEQKKGFPVVGLFCPQVSTRAGKTGHSRWPCTQSPKKASRKPGRLHQPFFMANVTSPR